MNAMMKYGPILWLRNHNLRLAGKAEDCDRAAPAMFLWMIVVISECLIGILAILMFVGVTVFLLACLIILSILVFAAWLVKMVGYPRCYNVLWHEYIRQNVTGRDQFP